jgi:hypothetical protein
MMTLTEVAIQMEQVTRSADVLNLPPHKDPSYHLPLMIITTILAQAPRRILRGLEVRVSPIMELHPIRPCEIFQEATMHQIFTASTMMHVGIAKILTVSDTIDTGEAPQARRAPSIRSLDQSTKMMSTEPVVEAMDTKTEVMTPVATEPA